ncbi:MAG: hypothetical protein V4505_00665 [Pseudomonadota bacterium]
MPANPLSATLQKMGNARDREAVRMLAQAAYNYLSSKTLATAGLVITGAGGTTAKTGASAYRALAGGTYIGVAAGTTLPALVGTVANGSFNVFVFSADAAGAVAVQMGAAGASLAAVRFPPVADRRAVLGYVEVHPTGTGSFVGGTTPLDDATVVPNALFVSTGGHFDQLAIF